MRGFKLLRLIVIAYLLAAFLYVVPFKSPERISRKLWVIVAYKGRYYGANEDGVLFSIVEPKTISQPVISCLELTGLKIPKRYVDELKLIPSVLKSDYVSEICLDKKLIIMRKGIMLYFHKWEEIEESMRDIEGLFAFISPKSILELFEGGNLVVLKGGWEWQGTSYMSQ